MTKKLKDLLVDSVVVIDAHENGYWERLCNGYRVFFTTADRAAIKALGILNLGLRGLSVEDLLNNLHGFSAKKHKMEHHFTKQWFQKALTEGFTEQNL